MKHDWQAAFDLLSDLVMIVDKDFKITAANTAVLKFLDKPMDDIIGKTCHSLFHDMGIPISACPLDKMKKTGKREQADMYIAENKIWMSATADPIFGGNKNIIGAIHIMRDITSRKKAAEILRESEKKYRSLFEMSRDSIMVIDEEDRIIDCNPTTLAMFKVSNKEGFIGKHLNIDFSPPNQPDGTDSIKSRQELVQKMHRDGACFFEWTYRRSDGSIFTTEVFLNEVSYHGTRAMQAVSRDITERKLTEKIILEDETRFRELFNNMGSGVAVYEAVEDGNDFVFKDMNKAGEKLSRVSISKIKGRRITECFPGAKEIGLLDALRVAWKTGEAQKLPEKLYMDGRITQWVDNYVYRLPGGEMVAIYNDITERKNIENALKDSEAMLKGVVTIVPVGLGIARNRVIEWANDYLLNIIGRNREEIIGKDSRIFYASEEGYSMVGGKFYSDLYEKGRASTEVDWKHKSGRVIHIFLTAAALYVEKSVLKIVFAALDITERKISEEKVRKDLHDLEIFYKASVGRERRILELKQKLADLEKEL